MRFGARLWERMRDRGALCVGIDPHASLLAAWGLPDTPEGLRDFSLAVVDEVGPVVAALKPQSAFYERHGSAGIAVLEEVLAACREVDALSILDVKRGDIGSTMAGYADAYLRPGAALEADAITLSPFLGPASLDDTVELAGRARKGVFVLALTSNPEGASVQQSSRDGETVAAQVARWAAHHNAGTAPVGDVGLVVGATTAGLAREAGVTLEGTNAPLLAPGLGAQGGTPESIGHLFGRAFPQVLASASRSVLSAGRGSMAAEARFLADKLRID